MNFSTEEINELANKYQEKSPQEILEVAFDTLLYLAISFSGAEDVVLVDIACKITKDFRVFTLDTGRLHPETYQLFDRVREKYGVRIEAQFPLA